MSHNNNHESHRLQRAEWAGRLTAVLLFGVVLCAAAAAQVATDREEVMAEVTGSWTGVLAVAGQRIATVLNVSESDGALTGWPNQLFSPRVGMVVMKPPAE